VTFTNRLLVAFSLLIISTLPTIANPTVTSPTNRESVSSPFLLSASAKTCDGVKVTTMGYSLDSLSTSSVVEGTSIDTHVVATPGKHNLHVKSWGKKVECTTTIAVTVPSTALPILAEAEATDADGLPVSPRFLGLAHEWASPEIGYSAQLLMGDQASGVDPIYRQLVANFAAWGSGPMVIRIGGNSTDTFTSPQSTQAFKELNEYNGALFYLGINLKNATLQQAQTIASTYYVAMPQSALLGLEIGNEPDGYGLTEAQFVANFNQWAVGIRAVTSPQLPIMGPSCSTWACSWGPMQWNEAILSTAVANNITAFSQHQYIEGQSPAADALLLPAAYPVPSTTQPLIAQAHQLGMPFRVAEWNSDWMPNTAISGQFQSALWGLKSLYTYASLGADGVNIFGNWDVNNGFNIAQISIADGTPNLYSLVQVMPLYYGALAFQMGTGHAAQVFPVTVTSGTSTAVSAFDTTDSTGTERMTLISLDESQSGAVTVHPQGTYTKAQVCYLSAPAYTSTTKVTLCGQTFDGSTNGVIQGAATYTTLDQVDGAFAVPLESTQAAIITFVR